jgi:predicted PurR-regulated permease PerM
MLPLKKWIKQTGMSPTWYTVLITYMTLFFVMGYITFFHNNDFATHPENFDKIIRDYDRPDKQLLVKKLLQDDANTFADQNTISSQAFNVVLGAIVSFLSSTLISKR